MIPALKAYGTIAGLCRPAVTHRLLSLALTLGCFLMFSNMVLAASDTWTGALNSSYNTSGNWAGGSVPNGTTQVATFPNIASTYNVTLPTSVISVDRYAFEAGAPSYNFSLPARSDLRLYGGGLVNNSSATHYYTVSGGSPYYSYLRFYNSASAGSGAQITTSSYGRTYFYNSANAGTANFIQNSGGYVYFQNSASANQASFTNNSGGRVYFQNSATADRATFANNTGGYVYLQNSASAGQASFNNSGYIYFQDGASAGQANFVTNSGGRVYFRTSATADTATFTNNSGGYVYFQNNAAANHASFTNNGGRVYFQNSATADQSSFLTNSGGNVYFYNTTNAGQASFLTNSGGNVVFYDTANASQANFINNGGRVYFYTNSTADRASFVNNAGGYVYFYNNATAGQANLTSNGGRVYFYNTSNANQATITTNSGGYLYFTNSARAGQANLINNSGGRTYFQSTSSAEQASLNNSGTVYFQTSATADRAAITNNTGGYVYFQNATSASQASLNNSGRVYFQTSATADQATITTNLGGYLYFTNSARAGQANLVTNSGGGTYFQTTSTADQATLTTNTGGNLYFQNSASAGQANLITNSGGNVYFQNTSSGGQTRLVTNAGGNVSFSGLTSAGTTVGSIAGAGNYQLGSRWLETGYDHTSTEVSGIISGTGGSLRKVGTGTLTLSGANTYTGATTVQSGELRVMGSLNSSLSIDSGARLSGTGTSTGSLTMNSGAVYALDINPSLSGTRVGLQIGGNATLNQNLVQYDFPAFPSRYVSQYRYDLLVYGGAATGTFVLPSFTSAFYTQELLHDTANRRFVLLTGWKPLASVVHSTVNQLAVARTLDRAWQAGALSEVIQPLLAMSGPQAEAAFGQLAGSEYAMSVRGLLNRGGDFKAGIQARLQGSMAGASGPQPANAFASLRAGSILNGTKNYCQYPEPPWPKNLVPGIQGYEGSKFDLGGAVTLVSAVLSRSDQKSPFLRPRQQRAVAAVERQERQGFWSSVTGQEERVKGDSVMGASGARIQTGGFQAGFDRVLGKVRLGVSASYSDSTVHYDSSLGYSRSRGGFGALYGQYQGKWRNWYANLALGYGVYSNDLKRNLNFVAPALDAHGNYRADLLLGFGEAGFDLLRRGPLTLQPFAGLLLAEVMTSSFTETGAAPYNLRFSGDTYRSRQSQVGGRVVLRDELKKKWPYRLQVEASWRHEFANLDMPVNAAFAANPTFGFTSFGAPRAANTLLVGGAGSLSLGRGVEVTARVAYSYDSAQSGVAVLAGLQKAW